MAIAHGKILDALTALAKKRELNHGYIFFGSNGAGKFSSAKAFAGFLEKGDWESGETLLQDAKVISPDAKGTIGIDTIREIRSFVYQKPNISAYRTVIIDKAEKMTEEAQNALLKVAEEPPESSLLILVLHDPEMLWPTLNSRFQKIYFPEVVAKGERAKVPQEVEAMKYLRANPVERTNMVKAFLETETWDSLEFLDALAVCISDKATTSKTYANAFHALMEMRRNFEYYNLNPRIQLEAWSQNLECRI